MVGLPQAVAWAVVALFVQVVAWDEAVLLQTSRQQHCREPLTPDQAWNCAEKNRQKRARDEESSFSLPEKSKDPCRNGTERCWISYGLYGKWPSYLDGALRNLNEIPKIFPGWRVRIYTDDSLPKGFSEKLKTNISEVVTMSDFKDFGGKIGGMFWRMLIMHDPAVDRILVRDTDSLVSQRERAAVDEWIASGLKWHNMKDHPFHVAAFQGGLMGVRRRPGESMALNRSYFLDALRRGGSKVSEMLNEYNGDQLFLAEEIGELAKKEGKLTHASFHCEKAFPGEDVRPFPVQRKGPIDFLGFRGTSMASRVGNLRYDSRPSDLTTGKCPAACRKDDSWLFC